VSKPKTAFLRLRLRPRLLYLTKQLPLICKERDTNEFFEWLETCPTTTGKNDEFGDIAQVLSS
jgi:hypothetical protein